MFLPILPSAVVFLASLFAVHLCFAGTTALTFWQPLSLHLHPQQVESFHRVVFTSQLVLLFTAAASRWLMFSSILAAVIAAPSALHSDYIHRFTSFTPRHFLSGISPGFFMLILNSNIWHQVLTSWSIVKKT